MASIVYGPVPSWRLGRSLGIDLLPPGAKTCCFDCIYCQLGRTKRPLTERDEFVSMDALARELQQVKGVPADYVTFSGMGEPTLAANLGPAIELVKAVLGLPVAVLTNSSLMPRGDVREALACAGVVVAKLDAPDERLYRRINRPVLRCSLAEILDGIGLFRSEYSGKLALQMMFVEANGDVAGAMASSARRLSPDEVQINTPLRPSPASPLSRERLAEVKEAFADLPAVSVYEAVPPSVQPLSREETVRRRPQ